MTFIWDFADEGLRKYWVFHLWIKSGTCSTTGQHHNQWTAYLPICSVNYPTANLSENSIQSFIAKRLPIRKMVIGRIGPPSRARATERVKRFYGVDNGMMSLMTS